MESYEVDKAQVEVYELVGGQFHQLAANADGRFEIEPMGVALGIWSGTYLNTELPWLRWWDLAGHLLLTEHERANREELLRQEATELTQQAEQALDHEFQRAQQAELKPERLAQKLRDLGIDP